MNCLKIFILKSNPYAQILKSFVQKAFIVRNVYNILVRVYLPAIKRQNVITKKKIHVITEKVKYR